MTPTTTMKQNEELATQFENNIPNPNNNQIYKTRHNTNTTRNITRNQNNKNTKQHTLTIQQH